MLTPVIAAFVVSVARRGLRMRVTDWFLLALAQKQCCGSEPSEPSALSCTAARCEQTSHTEHHQALATSKHRAPFC